MRTLPRFVVAASIALVTAVSSPVHAGNSGAVIAIHPTGVRVPAYIATQPDSGALVVFLDTRSGGLQVYAQRVDRNGRALLGEAGVLIATLPSGDYLDASSVAPDGAGGCIVTWSENRGATGRDIILQRVLPDGSFGYGPTGLVVCNASRDQNNTRVIPGPAGFYYVVWLDDRAAAGDLRDIYAQKMSAAGIPQWAANGQLVNATTLRPYGFYGINGVVSDLQGGFIATWSADGTGSGTRVQRVSPAGALQWTVNGVYFVNSSATVQNIAPDGTGGVWGTTSGWDGTYASIFIHRLSSAGVPQFPVGGIEFHSRVYQGNLGTMTLMRNGSGGMFVFGLAYYQSTATSFPIFRQEISPTGTLLRGPDGDDFAYGSQLPLIVDAGSALLMTQFEQVTATRTKVRVQRYAFDGTPFYPGTGIVLGRDEPSLGSQLAAAAMAPNGVIAAAWGDRRYATPINDYNYQVFGQAITPTGTPLWTDSEQPVIRSVKDAAADQGGHARVTWDASIADHPAAAVATEYRVWRALPETEQVAIDGAHPEEGEPFVTGNRTLIQYESLYWELAGTQSAATLPNYAMTVPTLLDSVAGNPADQSFMVEAVDDSNHHWFSEVLVGHSVDNLAPGAVQGASVFYSGGSSSIYWGGVSDPDLSRYEIFRGFTPGFVASDANRVGTTTQTTFSDSYGHPAYYRIAARDVHGNLGSASLAQGTVGIEDAGPVAWGLRSAWNRSGAMLELTLDVPHGDQGRIELFDVAGRRLWSSEFAGDAARTFQYQVDGAALKAGLVFARAVSISGRRLSSRAVLVR